MVEGWARWTSDTRAKAVERVSAKILNMRLTLVLGLQQSRARVYDSLNENRMSDTGRFPVTQVWPRPAVIILG